MIRGGSPLPLEDDLNKSEADGTEKVGHMTVEPEQTEAVSSASVKAERTKPQIEQIGKPESGGAESNLVVEATDSEIERPTIEATSGFGDGELMASSVPPATQKQKNSVSLAACADNASYGRCMVAVLAAKA